MSDVQIHKTIDLSAVAEPPKYMTSEGPTTADDPHRMMWYSASKCGYWTDDWNKLGRTGPGIPCCPECGMVGFECEAGPWLKSAGEYDGRGHPGYLAFLESNKGRCFAKQGGFIEAYTASKRGDNAIPG